jgi:UDPglucose 6-dehydrogenase
VSLCSPLFNKISKHFNNTLRDKTIGIWGLSFKPKTDDIRESSSVILIEKLLDEGAKIQAYDPSAISETKKLFGNRIQYFDDPYDALQGVNALALMTEWSEFHLPDFGKMSGLMREMVIFDGRNIYDPIEIRKLGFRYFSIGRK